MRTQAAKPAQTQADRKWWVVDATGQPLGRLAARVASILRGKHNPMFSPHVDCGDFVVVINADKVKLTGRKATNKLYYSHSGYPGSTRQESFAHAIERRPEFPIRAAVRGMLPKNVLGRQVITKLKVYASPEHPHQAQQPQQLSL